MRDGSPYNKRKLSLEWWGRLLYRMYYSSRCTHANNMSFKWPNKKENRSFVRLKFFLHGVLRFEQWTDLLAKLDIMTPSAASSLRVSNPKLRYLNFRAKIRKVCNYRTQNDNWVILDKNPNFGIVWIYQTNELSSVKNQFEKSIIWEAKLNNRLKSSKQTG